MVMIKANELRLGSIINDSNGEMRRVTHLKPNLVVYERNGSKNTADRMHEISGVPLTDEILEQAGFVKDAKYAWSVIGPSKHYKAIQLIDFRHMNDFFHVNEADTQSFKYLHQIQNLYHAKTGKELEIKL